MIWLYEGGALLADQSIIGFLVVPSKEIKEHHSCSKSAPIRTWDIADDQTLEWQIILTISEIGFILDEHFKSISETGNDWSKIHNLSFRVEARSMRFPLFNTSVSNF